MSQAAFGGSRKERLVLGTCAALLVAVFAFHFACTLLYLTPPNPIRIALHEPLEKYMQPYFYQSWRLFAPEPGGTDALVLVACRLRERDGEGVQESDFFDITTPLHEHRYRHRFSPGLPFSFPFPFSLSLPFPEWSRERSLSCGPVSGASSKAKCRGTAQGGHAADAGRSGGGVIWPFFLPP
jgi:hypothetical protein